MIDGHRDAWKYNSLNLYETSLEWGGILSFSDSLNDLGPMLPEKGASAFISLCVCPEGITKNANPF